MGFLSFQPSMLLSMVTLSPWNISGRLRLFSSSTERLRLRVIAEAKGAVALYQSSFLLWSFLLCEFFAPMVRNAYSPLPVGFVEFKTQFEFSCEKLISSLNDSSMTMSDFNKTNPDAFASPPLRVGGSASLSQEKTMYSSQS